MTNDTRRTIAVTARGHGRLSWLKVTYPDYAEHPVYDSALARELLACAGELPVSKRGLMVLLTEYRHALRALATATPDPGMRQQQIPTPHVYIQVGPERSRDCPGRTA